MMENFLKGAQYSDRRKAMPSWNDAESDVYYEWKDITDPSMIFATNTRIRMKPEKDYVLTSSLVVTKYYNKQDLMNAIAKQVDAGHEFSAKSVLSSRSQTIPKLQMKSVGGTLGWSNVTLGVTPTVLLKPTVFRIRPDHYHIVDSIDPINKGSVAFHDIDQLAAYVDNRIRTNGLDFSVRKVKYDR